MKRHLQMLGFMMAGMTGSPSVLAAPAPADGNGIVWQDIRTWGVEGRGWTEGLDNYYDRLPLRAKPIVGQSAWEFSRNSAGMTARFFADTPEIRVRYRLNSQKISPFPDMSATAGSGIDLYVRMDGADRAKPSWQFVGSTFPAFRNVSEVLATGIAPGRRLYQLYLPVYNGVEQLEIGVQQSARLEGIPPRTGPPLVFYGTSITQGGVASRPGLAFPAILGRRLDIPVVNLGFCGCGQLQPEIADLLAELNPRVFVLDSLQNMQPEAVVQQAEAFIGRLHRARPSIPILLVGFGEHPAPELFPAEADKRRRLNAALRAVYEKLRVEGFHNLHYLSGSSLLGADGEGTGDGLHPNAAGMLRYADAYEPVLRSILAEKAP